MSSIRMLRNLLRLRTLTLLSRRGFTENGAVYNKVTPGASSAEPRLTNVTGLSSKVIAQNNNPVGPGASKSSNYKNPEYFLYNRTSFFEAEIEMAKYRCPQPSNKTKS